MALDQSLPEMALGVNNALPQTCCPWLELFLEQTDKLVNQVFHSPLKTGCLKYWGLWTDFSHFSCPTFFFFYYYYFIWLCFVQFKGDTLKKGDTSFFF